MRKMTCTAVVAVMVAVSVAVEQPASSEDSWLPGLQHVRPPAAASAHTGAWLNQPWPAPEDEDEAAWDPRDTLAMGLRFAPESSPEDDIEDAGLDVVLGLAQQQQQQQQLEGSPWLAKRQPPRRLGSLVDLYRSLARGLSPFVPNTKNQMFSAAPERRSGRRPAACRFGPFGLVCWNAARRGAVMRQRSSQYAQ